MFAGAGGCSLGFKNAGVDIIAAFENAEPAINTYNMNFGPGQCRKVDLGICDFGELQKELGLYRGDRSNYWRTAMSRIYYCRKSILE